MSSNFIAALAGSRLYPITDKKISGLSHAEQVKQLADRGATVIQLREKLDSPRNFLREAEAALGVAWTKGVKIIINDRADIALALGAGVHLGQDDLNPTAARRLLGPDAIIGLSTHNLNQVQQALKFPIDYIAIGPIFTTSTKESPNHPIGLEQLAAVAHLVGRMPLVAIGGITLETAASVIEKGATACSIIRDLWLDHEQNPKKWASLWIPASQSSGF